MGNKYTLFFAAKEGRAEDLRWVLKNKKISPNLRDAESRLTPLHIACKGGNTKCAEILLEAGAKVNARTQDSMTAVHLVVYLGNKDCLKLLLDYDADVHATARFGSTALHQAVYFKRKECAELLIKNHAPLDAQENFGMTPLAVAVREHEWSMARFLIDQGANVDICDYLDCNTPLHLAVIDRSMRLVVLLLDSGASINLRNSKSETALDIAISQGELSLPIVLVLLDYGATADNTPFINTIHADEQENNDEVQVAEVFTELLQSSQDTPRSLKNLSRIAIRKLMLKQQIDKSSYEKLPKALRDYIQEFG